MPFLYPEQIELDADRDLEAMWTAEWTVIEPAEVRPQLELALTYPGGAVVTYLDHGEEV